MVENTNVEDTRRSFLGLDEETLYYIAVPTAEDIRGADWQYSKNYTNSLVEGITTSAEMMDILMRRGIVGPEFEQRATELTIRLNERIIKLDESETMEDKREVAVLVANAREELYQWNQRLNGPMSNTCEQIADDARLEYLTSCIIQKSDKSRLWNNIDEFLSEQNNQLAIKARFEVMLFLQGLESNFLESTPEAVAMKEVEADVLSKAQEAIKAIQEAAEEEASVKKEEVKKTTTRKRTPRKTKVIKKSTKKTED